MADENEDISQQEQQHQGIGDAYDDVSQDIDDLRNVDQTFNQGRGEQYLRDRFGKKKEDGEDNDGDGGQEDDKPEAEEGSDKPENSNNTDRPGQDGPESEGIEQNQNSEAQNPDAEATDTTGNSPADSSSPEPNAPGRQGPNPSQPGTDAAGNVGKNLPSAGEKAADAGSKLADTAQKTEDIVEKGEKAIDAVNKTVQAGEAAAEGVAAGAEGTALAAAPETAGISLAVAAAIEGAKQGAKAIKKGYDIVKKGLKYKDAAESAGRLIKKYGKCCVCCLIPPVIIGAIGYYVWTKLISLNPAVAAAKAVAALFHRNNSAGKLAFTDPASNTAIDNNEVSEVALRIMNDLAETYDVTIHYKGSPSPATGKENEPYEFDLVTTDYIKCTDTANNKKIEPPIKVNLEYDFSWPSVVAPGTENYLCGVGYYPQFDSPPVTIASSLYGPNEFRLSEIATYGPQAAQQKIYEAVELMMRKSAENEENEGDFPVSKVRIPPIYYDTNLKTGQSGLGETLKRRAKEIFPDRNPDEIIVSDTNTKGVHIGFD